MHSKAQIKLLESFSKMAKESAYIIYSTHSHYMVNPLWLEKAYIIDNRAIDYEDEDQIDSFAVRKTDVRAVKYRGFVAAHPTRTTYFQPALDALEVQFSRLERSSKALIIEGKFDYHPFVYLRRRVSREASPEVFPCSGAGDMGCLVNLFRGWGVDFRILLDDDRGGREGKKRYQKEYLLGDDQVKTLGDLSAGLAGKTFESVYCEDVKDATRRFFGSGNVTKRQYSLFFQELLGSGSNEEFADTEEAFRKISEWVDGAFGLTITRPLTR